MVAAAPSCSGLSQVIGTVVGVGVGLTHAMPTYLAEYALLCAVLGIAVLGLYLSSGHQPRVGAQPPWPTIAEFFGSLRHRDFALAWLTRGLVTLGYALGTTYLVTLIKGVRQGVRFSPVSSSSAPTLPSAVLERLAVIDSTSLADAGKGSLRVLPAALRPVRPGLRMLGLALTVDARADLMPMLAGLRTAGRGDVLVVSGNDQHAVAGELFASEALRRGVAGIVIDGFCRDRRTLATLDLPVYARGSVPSACPARAVPVINVPITIGSVTVDPGDVVLGDDDGVVVGSADEIVAVLDQAETIQRREEALRDAILTGKSLFDHLDYARHLAALSAGEESRLTFS